MNTKIMSIGAATILTALPFAGFAAADSVVDTIKISVASACTLTVTNGEEVGADVTLSISGGLSNKNITGSHMSITCNNVNGWELKAMGGEGETPNTTLHGGEGTTPIQTGTNLEGGSNTSAWAFKASGNDKVTVASGFENFAKVPSTKGGVKIAENNAENKTVAGATVDITYGVGINTAQPAGTYEGKVTYTLSEKAAS